jgi:hypothetical protein
MGKIHDIENFSLLVNHNALELFHIVKLWRHKEIDPDLLFTSVQEIAYKLLNASNGK